MKELADILGNLEKLDQGEKAVVATVVKVRGSTYRRPGARMLVTKNDVVGSISGGCLEDDIAERGRKLIATGEVPHIVTYDLREDEEMLWGLGLGCNGIMHVLLELVDAKDSHLAFMRNCLRRRHRGVIATIFAIQESASIVGEKICVNEDHFVSSVHDSQLNDEIVADAKQALQNGSTHIKEYTLAEDKAEVLIEVLQPNHLIVFGAGHDAIPVVHFAKAVGWQVTVVDSRPAYATCERFPQADEVILCQPQEIGERLSLHPSTIAVVMTHNYLHDLELLSTLVVPPLRYLGILGPRARTQRLLEQIAKRGIAIPQQQQHMYSPIGLDIGAETPEEIAIAIIAEIQAVLSRYNGGFLRDRKGAIHEPAR